MSTLAFVDLVRERGYKVGAEIGVWRGDRAQALLDSCDLTRLYLVDPWLQSFNVFPAAPDDQVPQRMPEGRYQCTMGEPVLSQLDLEQMAHEVHLKFQVYGDRVVILRTVSELAALSFAKGSLDFVLIDAIHLYRYVKQDILAWLPKVRPGGMLAGDDYGDPGVRKAVDEICPVATTQAAYWVYTV